MFAKTLFFDIINLQNNEQQHYKLNLHKKEIKL